MMPIVSISLNFYYLCTMKRRIITFGSYFSEFIGKLTIKEREKIDYALVLLKKHH
jgi:hypothetical protein